MALALSGVHSVQRIRHENIHLELCSHVGSARHFQLTMTTIGMGAGFEVSESVCHTDSACSRRASRRAILSRQCFLYGKISVTVNLERRIVKDFATKSHVAVMKKI
jgi:hypothetical protein